MCSAADVLTLSATPIPRTLNMALSGIRDMSVIEEAPHDRHPVQTYVLEYDSGVIADAIRRELRRGRAGVLPPQRRGLHHPYRRPAAAAGARGPVRHRPREDERGGALRGVAAAFGPGDRRAGVHHHHRDRRGRPLGQHPYYRKRRPHGPVPAPPAPGTGGPQQPPGLRLSHLHQEQGPHRDRPEAALRHPGVHRVRLGLQDRHARPGDPGRGQYSGRGAARPHGDRGLRHVRQAPQRGGEPDEG